MDYIDIKEIKSIYDKAHSSKDISEINREIIKLNAFLNQKPFDKDEARKEICKVNEKHPENVSIHNFFFPANGSKVSIAEANEQSLKNDLEWKRLYLISKSQAKSFDEFIKMANELKEYKRSSN